MSAQTKRLFAAAGVGFLMVGAAWLNFFPPASADIMAPVSAPIVSPSFTGQATVTPTAAVSVALDQAQAAGGSALLAFATTSGIAVGQQVSGTNIPVGVQVASIVATAQATATANGSFLTGQKVIPIAVTAPFAVGQQCADTTAAGIIGAGNVIASIQSNVSITLTSNTTAGSSGNADNIVCDPVVTLSQVTASAATGTITFYANATALSTSSAIVDLGDLSVYGNASFGGTIELATTTTNAPPAGGIANITGNGISIYGTGGAKGLVVSGTGVTTANVGLSIAGGSGNSVASRGFITGSSTLGGTYSGSGSTNDVTITNKTQGAVITIPTGTTSPAFPSVTTGTNADFACLAAGGVMTLQASACTISSMRFKNLIGDYRLGNAVGTLARLDPIVFTRKEDRAHPDPDWNAYKPQIGLSAENVAEIEPRCAIYEQDGTTPKSYRQECLIAILVAAVKTQQHEIDALKARHR